MQSINFSEGYTLAVDKPYSWTSADVVRKVKNLVHKKTGQKNIKVGHAGTLDPLATGLLIICIGKATKQAEQIQSGIKEYIADVTFGATTPSYDMEKEIDQFFPFEHIDSKLILDTFSQFIGEIDQIPPAFSAKSLNGKRAYEYAREGSDVEMKSSKVNIYELELIQYISPVATIRVKCSKGTYIRSLARDLGVATSSGAYLSALRRTKSGDYCVDKALTINEIETFFRL